jgi:7-carboxy-7-deazaguanine synthase
MTEFARAPLRLEVAEQTVSDVSTNQEATALGDIVLRFSNLKGGPEVFDTLQGEGSSMGKPAVFARFSGCNLRCSWCDTPNTWVWNQALADGHDDGRVYDQAVETITIPLGEAVDRITAFSIKRLVVTGGEPLLQRKALEPFFDKLRERRSSQLIEIETNGTIPPGKRLSALVDQFNVSPKLENSHNPLAKRRRSLALAAFAGLPQAFFKFVVVNPNDLAEIDEIVEHYAIEPERVYLMPEGRSPAEINAGALALVEECKVRNYTLGMRQHILLWGDKRGV